MARVGAVVVIEGDLVQSSPFVRSSRSVTAESYDSCVKGRRILSRLPRNKDSRMSVKDSVENVIKDIDFDNIDYQLTLKTSAGDIRLNLFPQVAPVHCSNIIGLADSGFYNNIVFHRVISGFMIQAGCPEGRGTGGPGYHIDAEFNSTPHEPGVLSMARTSDPNSAGSQFFICLEKQPSLDNQYTVFGQTADAESLEVVQKIGAVATDPSDRPLDDVTILGTEVTRTQK